MSSTFTVGLHIDGAGSHPAAAADALEAGHDILSARWATQIVDRAETAGFSYATFAGSHLPPAGPGAPATTGRIDAVQQAAFSGPLTSRIGLIPQVPVTYLEPFHTATQLASVDYASRGRAGWLVSAENSVEAAAQFGRTVLDDATTPTGESELQHELRDVVAVGRRLWDTWEDDAVIRDLPTGRYLDRDKVHDADFAGASFSVRGASIVPRPPQGQLPVLVPAARAAIGTEHAVSADAVLLPASRDLAEQARRLRQQAATASAAPQIIADLQVVLDSRGESATDRLARLDGAAVWGDPDGARFAGTADELIERIEQLAHVVDGVRLIPAELGADLDELRYAVLPALIARGVVSAPTVGTTLREIFGLPAAHNAFAVERDGDLAGDDIRITDSAALAGRN
ncbi:LLM class flavin-dependent oxidoreductase [Pseudoclavibacter sp. CFCC 13611]|uniref:LLM class flavin-dependent oxidoreductase n=1 Tax=Pseudoclavibacter sp. CFCC 13611 TaxID=2615178 RepID=UPI001301025A|nr:LLM class flavin-dependent oxidoreductase [Pseudoclavibacter sp. CFCC 13611]KAB1664037.1 LLM class flavin-dependent oxidoreductase [Pseudoclavibacter sp. CFCC 13611]